MAIAIILIAIPLAFIISGAVLDKLEILPRRKKEEKALSAEVGPDGYIHYLPKMTRFR